MKNRTLFVLLLVPFVVGLLSFVSVQAVYNTVAADIVDISWDYEENEGFQIQTDGYQLKAEAVVDDNLVLAPGNDLVWYLKNESEEGVARIDNDDKGNYYLYALKEGTCQVVCANERGTKSKRFSCYSFANGTIIINPAESGSGEKIDPVVYCGEYDMSYLSLAMDSYTKKESSMDLKVTLFGDVGGYIASAVTTNIRVNDTHVDFVDGGEAIVRFTSTTAPFAYTDYSFTIVDETVNVRSYNDLLMATNFSSLGEAIVLRTNLESLKNTYRYDSGTLSYTNELLKGNTALFGNYDFSVKTFSFDKEMYSFASTGNTDFIDQYNEKTGSKHSKDVHAGIHLKKSLYGNGFTINANELCFPNNGKIAANGKLTPDADKDYFQGPLPYVTIGDLTNTPIVKAFGQDNSGIYIDGDNIVVDDLRMKNCNDVDNMYDLTYCGSVVEVNGSDITIRNSILSNGRTVLRSFDAPNLLVDNCILKNANEFIAVFGSNKRNSYDTEKTVSVDVRGTTVEQPFSQFFGDTNDSSYNANSILNYIMSSGYSSSLGFLTEASNALMGIQEGLDNDDGIRNSYDYEASFHNTSFYNSGVFSIAFESSFNGPYLYSGLPTLVSNYTEMFGSVLPKGIGGTSYPVKLDVDETNSFYDWKDIDTIDVSSLVEENISRFVNEYLGRDDVSIGINDLFPIRSILKDLCREAKYVYSTDGKQYLNTKVAWYGGGKNLSTIDLGTMDDVGSEIVMDLVKPMLSGQYSTMKNDYAATASKAILMATGTNPFRFLTNGSVTGEEPIGFLEAPAIEDLINNAKA